MLPSNLPPCLRPMIKPKEYAKLAYQVNQMLAWDCYISEAIVYTLIALFTPPLAALVIVSTLYFGLIILIIFFYLARTS
jgi:hypothetical protein